MHDLIFRFVKYVGGTYASMKPTHRPLLVTHCLYLFIIFIPTSFLMSIHLFILFILFNRDTPTEITNALSEGDLADCHSVEKQKNKQISQAVTDGRRKIEKKTMKEDNCWPDSTALNIQQFAIHYG